jgi:tRNA-dihydrouridine synthase B
MSDNAPSIKKAPGTFLLDDFCPHPLLLAPMVGLTHYAVRASVAEFLPDPRQGLWSTEMLNSRRVASQRMHENPEVFFYDAENGVYPQLLANEEEFIRIAVPRLESWGAKAIDINMGCPVKKALKHNYGVALMGDPAYAAEVVRMTVQHATVPVSVKLRAAGVKSAADAEGEDGEQQKRLSNREKNRLAEKNTEIDFEYLANFIEGLYRAGASWITIHPRTAEQMRRGTANWTLVKKLKDHFKNTPYANRGIIANGDVQTREDIRNMFEATGADRIMIGRALMAKPWLIDGNIHNPEPDQYEQGELYGKFLKSVVAKFADKYELQAGMRRMRFLIVYSRPWVEFGEFLYGRVMAATTYEELAQAMNKFFDQKQKIIARTTLRS